MRNTAFIALRKAAGMTQQQLADAVGVHIRQIQRIEYAETSLDDAFFRTGLNIAQVLHVDPYELLAVAGKESIESG